MEGLRPFPLNYIGLGFSLPFQKSPELPKMKRERKKKILESHSQKETLKDLLWDPKGQLQAGEERKARVARSRQGGNQKA